MPPKAETTDNSTICRRQMYLHLNTIMIQKCGLLYQEQTRPSNHYIITYYLLYSPYQQGHILLRQTLIFWPYTMKTQCTAGARDNDIFCCPSPRSCHQWITECSTPFSTQSVSPSVAKPGTRSFQSFTRTKAEQRQRRTRAALTTVVFHLLRICYQAEREHGICVCLHTDKKKWGCPFMQLSPNRL